MQLTLTERESELLHGLLQDYLHDLKLEAARSEHREIRHLLLERQDLIERLLAELAPGTEQP